MSEPTTIRLGDLEVQRLMLDALRLAGIGKLQLDIGHVAVFRTLVKEAGVGAEVDAGAGGFTSVLNVTLFTPHEPPRSFQPKSVVTCTVLPVPERCFTSFQTPRSDALFWTSAFSRFAATQVPIHFVACASICSYDAGTVMSCA